MEETVISLMLELELSDEGFTAEDVPDQFWSRKKV